MTTSILLLEIPDQTEQRVLGCIQVTQANKKRSLPLKGVQIDARVADRLSHVTLSETFQNPYREHLEAVYIFPLSGGCAVSSFKMKVGDRTIVGTVGEREEAIHTYEQAKHDGKRAALMEQERDDVFTVQVGNLPPGEEVTVTITYSEKLAYFDNGTTELRLPLVVAPRYTPGLPLDGCSVGDGTELDTDLVPDASRISPPRLAPGVDAKTALSLSVEIVGEEPVEDLSCSQHATKIGTSKSGVKVSLSREDELLNRDFVLRWRVAADSVRSKFIAYADPTDQKTCFGMISVMPPQSSGLKSPPRDVLFVVDRSGSMSGIKMTSAARACAALIDTLGPKDRFAVQAFDDTTEWMNNNRNRFVSADESGKEHGQKYLRTIAARGGTEMYFALQDAIATMRNRRDSKRRLPIVVILTDGEVSDESRIFQQIQTDLNDIRIFTIGVDTAVNDGFLRRLATLGGGTSTFVQPGAELEDALSGIGREIGTPLITDLSIEDANCKVDRASLVPGRIPDLFAGRATTVFFKFTSEQLERATVKIQGTAPGGQSFEEEISAVPVDMPSLSQLWARGLVVDLEDKYRLAAAHEQHNIHRQIVELACAHSLLTKFTAFVVVDEAEIVNSGGTIRKVVQPVEVPALWNEAVTFGCPAAAPSQSFSGAGWGASTRGGAGAMRQAVPSAAPVPSPDTVASPRAKKSLMHKAKDMMFGGAPIERQECADASASYNQSIPGSAGGGDRPGSNQDILGNTGSFIAFEPSPPGTFPTELDAGTPHKSRTSKAELDALKFGFEKFKSALTDALKGIQQCNLPDASLLDSARTELVEILSRLSIAGKLPLLQKYLRSDVIRLVYAIEYESSVSEALKQVLIEQESLFAAVVEEVKAIEGDHKPFWRATV